MFIPSTGAKREGKALTPAPLSSGGSRGAPPPHRAARGGRTAPRARPPLRSAARRGPRHDRDRREGPLPPTPHRTPLLLPPPPPRPRSLTQASAIPGRRDEDADAPPAGPGPDVALSATAFKPRAHSRCARLPPTDSAPATPPSPAPLVGGRRAPTRAVVAPAQEPASPASPPAPFTASERVTFPQGGREGGGRCSLFFYPLVGNASADPRVSTRYKTPTVTTAGCRCFFVCFFL